MAISFCFVASLMFSSISSSVKFPMATSCSFIVWFFGRIIVPVAGFMFSISPLRLTSHWDSLTMPFLGSYSATFI